MRPGPRRTCEISKPRPSPSSMLSFGTRTLLKRRCMWPRGAWSWPNTCIGPRISTPGVSLGTRICETGDVVLFAADHPLVADQLCRCRDVLGIGRGDVRLGHRIGGTNLAGE